MQEDGTVMMVKKKATVLSCRVGDGMGKEKLEFQQAQQKTQEMYQQQKAIARTVSIQLVRMEYYTANIMIYFHQRKRSV